jgi:AcrR family transcriptional regulator
MVEARTARSRRTRAALVDAVHDELRRTGAFTVDQVVERAGCAPATYYAHFPTKDDAVAAAFGTVLDELERLAVSAFGLGDLERLGPAAFARGVEQELVAFFRTESLVFRAALARLSEHRPIRTRYRAAETRVLATIGGFLEQAEEAGLVPGPRAAERAAAVLVVAQGCNNPRLLRAPDGDPVHDLVALALAATLLGSPPR